MIQIRPLLILCALAPSIASAQVSTNQANLAGPRGPARDAIIQSVSSYVDAFNNRDASATAAHWAAEGQWIDLDNGQVVNGRSAIEKQFEDLFRTMPECRLDVHIDSIRFVADTVAIEEGVARVTKSDSLSKTAYTAIHVSDQGTWRLDSIRERTLVAEAELPPAHEGLRPLEWMIGTWVDESDDAMIETTCQWTKNGNFITRSFKGIIDRQVDFEGTQVIGWDQRNKQIRSWMFDSDGGFGEAIWTLNNGEWKIQLQQTFPDGRKASCVNVILPISPDAFMWRSTDRYLDGKRLNDIPAVEVKRRR